MSKLPDGYRHISFESIDSTNRHAIKAALGGERGNLWVTAGRQTEGRGRRGRPWSSEKGNLFASLLLIDPGPMKSVGQLPLLSATAVHRAICDVMPPDRRDTVSIKWPNDVLMGNRKLCGIMLESTMLANGQRAVVIGIGINCRTHPEETDGLAAASLSQDGYDVAPEVLFERLASHMAERMECWSGGKGIAAIREDWLVRAKGPGLPVVARLPDEEIHGIFERLDEQGGLVMLLPDGKHRVIYAGDVFLSDAVNGKDTRGS